MFASVLPFICWVDQIRWKPDEDGERMGGNHNGEADRWRDRDEGVGKTKQTYANVLEDLPTLFGRLP